MNRFVFLTFFNLLCLCALGYSQTDSLRQVSIRGRVLDSLAESVISEATVTLYHKDGKKILQYGFTNSQGAFNFSAVPSADSIFSLEVSHVGFMPSKTTIRLKAGTRTMDVGSILLSKKSILIEEVNISRPPILMKGDTLEINPEAFDLQPNALVEDLLKKVPGVVVWGDGEITVNGTKVTRVLVEGKPFFGGDVVTSTRNLPSGAVDKIQVYEQKNTRPNEEVKLEMDIRLKKSHGLFGKIQGGIGNQDRMEGIMLLNYFNPKNQISVFGGKNNTNKQVRSLQEALRSNVYKAGGEDINVYAPAFGRPGLNRFSVGGGKFERQWNTLVKSNIDMLYTSNDSKLNSDLLEFRYFEDRSDQKVAQLSNQNNRQDRLTLGGNATFRDKYQKLHVTSRIGHTKSLNEQHRDRNVWDDQENILSTLITDNSNSSTSTTGDFSIAYETKYKEGVLNSREKFSLSYQLQTSDRDEEKHQISSFIDEVQDLSESVNRIKDQRQRHNSHDLKANINLQPLIRKMGIRNWDLMFNNTARWVDLDANQRDRRLGPSTNSFTLLNERLTYRDQFNEFEWMPGLSLGRSKIKIITRGIDTYGFTSAIDLSTTVRKNQSDNSLRKLDQRTFLFIPSGSIYYQQRRQLWSSSWTLGLKTNIRQPTLEQLVAVMDEAQKDYNRIGNRNLKQEEQYKFALEYSRTSSINSSSHFVKINYTLISNQMVDSSLYLADGERISYVVNAEGRPTYDVDYRYQSAPKLGNVPLNLSLSANIKKGQNYYFNNGVKFSNDNITSYIDGKATGVFYEHLLVSLRGSSQKFLNTSKGRNTRNSGNNSLGIDLTVTWPRRTTFISSITGANSYIKGISSDYLYFWNVHVYYRMLKNESLEIKLSTFDILNNSKNITTYSDNNIVRREQTNNLRQYFMLSLSYYPRFF